MLDLAHAYGPAAELLAKHQSQHCVGCRWDNCDAFSVLVLTIQAPEKWQVFIASFDLSVNACCGASPTAKVLWGLKLSTTDSAVNAGGVVGGAVGQRAPHSFRVPAALSPCHLPVAMESGFCHAH